MREDLLSWIEVDREALAHNVALFREIAGPTRELLVVVKGNAYGHGMLPVSQVALGAGASWLGVFDPADAFRLREAGIGCPVLVMGPTPSPLFARAAAEGVRVTVASSTAAAAVRTMRPGGLKIHLKIETGTTRQGLRPEELPQLAGLQRETGVAIEGAYTHFADIEDTTDHTFAFGQLDTFTRALTLLAGLGIEPPLPHTACTAAGLLFPETRFGLLRTGIGAYGLWPSRETLVSARHRGEALPELRPAMCWKSRIAQIKRAEPGEYVGYGRTFRVERPSRLAVLPVGYFNGYDRGLSNKAHLLIRGRRARLCGRVMMNLIVADVTDIPDARAGDEAVLLGSQGTERISAETMAGWLDTINYEVVTRAEPYGERFLV